jgi:two-component sensor histidine kinase
MGRSSSGLALSQLGRTSSVRNSHLLATFANWFQNFPQLFWELFLATNLIEAPQNSQMFQCNLNHHRHPHPGLFCHVPSKGQTGKYSSVHRQQPTLRSQTEGNEVKGKSDMLGASLGLVYQSSMKSPAPVWNTPGRRFFIILGVATVFALFFATKDTFGQLANGMEIRLGKSLWWKAMEWYAWGLFAPVIFRVCQRFNPNGGGGRLILGQLASGTLFSLLHCCILTTGARIEAHVLHTGFSWPRLFEIVLANHFHEDLLTYAAIISVWYALDYYYQFLERGRQASELEAHLVRARLQTLKMQLHPHFLFNTLNGIAALNYEDPKAANRMLARLSELLRMTLEDDGVQEVPLRKELEFNRCYLALEQIRLGERLATKLDIAPETLDAYVPNLLLQPLVENAIRHGIAPYSARGEICIHTHRDKDRLHLQVTDSGPGLTAGKDAPGGAGLGLKNTRARLQQLYGETQQLELKNAEGGGWVVRIVIPFRSAQNQSTQLEVQYEDSNAHR